MTDRWLSEVSIEPFAIEAVLTWNFESRLEMDPLGMSREWGGR
jgi:hypothetical protein